MRKLKVFWTLCLGVAVFLLVVVVPGLAAHHGR